MTARARQIDTAAGDAELLELVRAMARDAARQDHDKEQERLTSCKNPTG